MKILSLYLKGAIRLELSGIKEITITPETSIMAVIGSNGSGKSSVLHYLSPNVPDKADFVKEGIKRIRIEHEGKIYCLTSDFSINKHSFLDETEGVELNIGGTASAQKTLVKDYFRYDVAIHALLTGKERFTQMSSARRKDWFTRLCDSDYTYAIVKYDEAKEKLRDATGALKKVVAHQAQLRAIETGKDELGNINANIKARQERIEELNRLAPYDARYGSVFFEQDNKAAFDNSVVEIEKTRRDMLSNLGKTIAFNLDGEYVSALKDEMLSLRQEKEGLELSKRNLVSQYTELENRIQEVKITNQSEIELVEKKISELKGKKSDLENRIPDSVPYSVSNPELMQKTYRENAGELMGAIEYLSAFGEEEITQAKIKLAEELLTEYKTHLNDLNIKINRVDERIEAYTKKAQEHKATCPNCQHEFHPGYSKENHDKFIEIKKGLQEKIDEFTLAIEKQQAALDDYNTKYGLLRNFVNVSKECHLLMAEFSVDVIKKGYHVGQAFIIKRLFKDFIEKIDLMVEINKLNAEIESNEKSISNTNTVDEKQHEELVKQLNRLSKLVDETNEALFAKNERLKKLTELTTAYDEFKAAEEKLEGLLLKNDELITEMIKYDFYVLVNKFISQEQEEIAALTKLQMEIITREKNIEMVDKQIEEIKKEISIWEAIMDALNPKDGLIAEGLLGFIRLFLSRVNGFIKSIWTYPLIIHTSEYLDEDCGDYVDELTYRFPMTVGLSKKMKSDISVGSDGILEVIDLAFKMLAMKSLGLVGYPIFLDEFGRTFDAKHRENALRLVEKLSEEFIEDQIFMVSHQFMEYSVLNDVSFCVLSEENIVLPPKNLNKGVEIIR